MLFVLGVAALVLLISHKSGLSTFIGLGTAPIIIGIVNGFTTLAFFPLLLLCLMLLKKYQVARVRRIAG
jgi:hypothetical protein